MTIAPAWSIPAWNFLLSLAVGLYRCSIFLFGNIALRYVPTRYAIKAMKELRLDTRQAWERERLYFLNQDLSLRKKIAFLRFYDTLTPVGMGLAWGCAMEAAYRIYNLAWLQYCHPELTPAQRGRIERSLLRNARFIGANLEVGSFNNHYAFNIFGLLIAASRDASIDEGYWTSELVRVLREQFNGDGTNFEASTAYHGLMLEALARLAALRPGLADLVVRHIDMPSCIRFAAHAEFSALFVGDADGSVVVKDRSTPSALARKIFGVPACDLPVVDEFPDFAVAFFREHGVEAALWNPRIGQGGKGGHNHNDSLSLSLSLDGHALIADPGVPFYAVARNRFRRSRAHATPFPDGFEPFGLVDRFRVTDRGTRSLAISQAGAAACYGDGEKNAQFRRSLEWHCNGQIRIDIRDGSDNPALCPVLRLVLPPGIVFEPAGAGIRLTHPLLRRAVTIEIDAEDFRWEPRAALFSPNYGKLGIGHVITARPMLPELAWSMRIS